MITVEHILHIHSGQTVVLWWHVLHVSLTSNACYLAETPASAHLRLLTYITPALSSTASLKPDLHPRCPPSSRNGFPHPNFHSLASSIQKLSQASGKKYSQKNGK
jgi:hypothetical protein